MRLTVVAVGTLKERHWRDAAGEYTKRLSRYAKLDIVEVPDRDIAGDARRALAAEGEGLLRALPPAAFTVVLDPGGTERSSEELARWLDAHATGGSSHVAFVVGGSGGLDPRVLAAARERLSLSRMTLPHQLARVVLLEQLYRAFRISRGEPYHL